MKTILCYGDSNTYGYNPVTGGRWPEDIRWTGRLQQLLGDEYKVIEEGCNGRTTMYKAPGEGWKSGLPEDHIDVTAGDWGKYQQADIRRSF